MAIRIQCSGDTCRKRIVIDDAFAGGMCRCPFCSAIVMVPGGDGTGTDSAQRPESPPQRPGSPAERPESPAESGVRPAEPPGTGTPPSQPKSKVAVDPNSVPIARADRTVTYILFGAVALLAAAVIIGLVFAFAHGTGTTRSGANTANTSSGTDGDSGIDMPLGSDPFKIVAQGPAIAGDVALLPPVVYVIDAGQGMAEVFDNAVAISCVSILSLRPTDRFAVIISANAEIAVDSNAPPPPFDSAAAARPRTAVPKPADETGDESTEPADKATAEPEPAPAAATKARTAGKDLYLPGGWLPGNASSEKAFQKWGRDYQERDEVPRGQTDVLASIDTALALKPKHIVVFTLKDLIENGQLSPEAAAIAAKAKGMGIPIVAVGLHKGSGVNDQVKLGLEKFSAASGAEARNYGFDRLQEWATEFYSR